MFASQLPNVITDSSQKNKNHWIPFLQPRALLPDLNHQQEVETPPSFGLLWMQYLHLWTEPIQALQAQLHSSMRPPPGGRAVTNTSPHFGIWTPCWLNLGLRDTKIFEVTRVLLSYIKIQQKKKNATGTSPKFKNISNKVLLFTAYWIGKRFQKYD